MSDTATSLPEASAIRRPAFTSRAAAPARRARGKAVPLDAAQMADLWAQYKAAQAGYSENDPATITPFERVQARLADARTFDLQGIAYKLEAFSGGFPAIIEALTRDLSAEASRRATIQEPLLPLWRAVRAAWAAEVASEDDDGPTVKAYHAAHAAFHKVKPTTMLGLFLTLLDSDDGDNFADEQPAAVDAMIAQLQAGNAPIPGAKARRASTVPVRSPASTRQLDESAHDEVFSLQHVAELLTVFGKHVGTPHADWSDTDMQGFGLRIEYLSGLVRHHADTIGEALDAISASQPDA